MLSSLPTCPGGLGARLRRRRHHALDLRHGGQRGARSTSTRPCRPPGSRPAVPCRRAWSTSSSPSRRRVTRSSGITGAGAEPGGRDGRQPDRGRLHGLRQRHSHQLDSAHPKPNYLDLPRGGSTPARAVRRACDGRLQAGGRKYIQEKLSKTIMLNISDQFFDLQGGYALNSSGSSRTRRTSSPNIKGQHRLRRRPDPAHQLRWHQRLQRHNQGGEACPTSTR